MDYRDIIGNSPGFRDQLNRISQQNQYLKDMQAQAAKAHEDMAKQAHIRHQKEMEAIERENLTLAAVQEMSTQMKRQAETNSETTRKAHRLAVTGIVIGALTLLVATATFIIQFLTQQ